MVRFLGRVAHGSGWILSRFLDPEMSTSGSVGGFGEDCRWCGFRGVWDTVFWWISSWFLDPEMSTSGSVGGFGEGRLF